jgi:hypothetical protein
MFIFIEKLKLHHEKTEITVIIYFKATNNFI